MSPDRGSASNPAYQQIPTSNLDDEPDDDILPLDQAQQRRINEPRNFAVTHEGSFTVRGIIAGLCVGLIICFSNMYFGLQTGWISSMAMPSSLLGFAVFKSLSKQLAFPFTPVENVLVQTVAGSMGTMPLGCGFVGVMPALNYLLQPEENGPLFLSMWKLILWALALCYFGVVFAVPLRRQVIIRERLKFPSGTATALMIGVLHGRETVNEPAGIGLTRDNMQQDGSQSATLSELRLTDENFNDQKASWKSKVNLLITSFAISGFYTLLTYFFPILRNLPIFGSRLAQQWLWTLNPSFAYVGQGIIMGAATTTHMLIGAVVGWGILSPLAKSKNWAPGPVGDWETGSKGWIVWISLSIMLADAVISLGYIVFRPVLLHGGDCIREAWHSISKAGDSKSSIGYTPISESNAPLSSRESTYLDPQAVPLASTNTDEENDPTELDASPEYLVSNRTVTVGLVISIVFCVVSIRIVFGNLVPIYAIVLAVLMALILSIMGVRALGETDLNPVSGISKLAQLFFALIIPQSNKNSVLINLIAGAISEAGALQAGDLMQDLKTGHLLGAAPNVQFWGQIIGSTVGAVVSALLYKLYTNVYEIPGKLFEVPTGFVWIFTARLVTGKGLPDMAWQWAVGAAVIFTILTGVRILGAGKHWHPFIPGGIAVAVGMYNVPSFTLARAIGGFVHLYWRGYRKRSETTIVILASGLILGEGVVSIVNLILASTKVPHL